MTNALPLRERYNALIDEIVQSTLKGKISSQAQVYRLLVQGVTPGTGEVFELALSEKLTAAQQLVDTEKDELKQAKATRSLRAIKTIQGQWLRAQEQNQATEAIAQALREITTVDVEERLTTLLRAIDPNRKYPLNVAQIQQLSTTLQQQAAEPLTTASLQELGVGLSRGVATWERLQTDLISWMYESNQGPLGFEGVPGERGPWALWAKKVTSELPQLLFRTLAVNGSPIEFGERQRGMSVSDWVELAVVLQYLQRGLVSWFDQQAYNIEAGSKLSISTFLTFAVIWSQLASGFGAGAKMYADGSSQIMLQVLRNFAQRPYFPLYGGIFASFSGSYLREALDYLDEPLRRQEGTQEKARILTLLGYSQRAMGEYERSHSFHEQALDIARTANDRPCEIANLNHLSRTEVAQKNYSSAINYASRALILSRQAGDSLGEANALASLGYSEVMQAQQLEQIEPETYETAINYLLQGLRLCEKLGDRQSQALCYSSLGIAYLVISQPQTAIKYLEDGFKTAQISGDFYLQGLNLANLAEAYYNLQDLEKAIYTGSLGMYLLEQIASQEWRKPAGLLTILQGQMGAESFQNSLQQNRTRIIAMIGVDGYDYIPQLLALYRQSM